MRLTPHDVAVQPFLAKNDLYVLSLVYIARNVNFAYKSAYKAAFFAQSLRFHRNSAMQDGMEQTTNVHVSGTIVIGT